MGLLKKIKRTVRKIVPKEVSGIMRAAAPFVAPYSLPAAAALSIGGQLRAGQGRISPLETVLALAPSDAARNLTKKVPGGQALDQFLYGSPALGDFDTAQQGLIGIGGEQLTPSGLLKGKLLSPTLDKAGNPVLSKARVGAAVVAGLSLTQTQQQIEEEGEAEGLEPSEIARLQAEAAEMWEDFDTTAFRPNVAQGGLMRTNYALGSRPTEQESGLGGLPIEADMRYTGGFMPYGAKEKADDVPARLSKNEFVFTADAVRGAGGGDINTGAKRMYQSMKQLEQMGKRA